MSKGPKNQETDQFLTSSGNGAQYSETGGRCNCGNHPYRQSSDTGGFLLAARLRNASQIWSEEEIEGAEWKFDGKPMGSIRVRDILSHWVQPPDAENRMSGGVGEVMGEIPSPRPDRTVKRRKYQQHDRRLCASQTGSDRTNRKPVKSTVQQTSGRHTTVNNKPGFFALPSTRKMWQNRVLQQQSRFQVLKNPIAACWRDQESNAN